MGTEVPMRKWLERRDKQQEHGIFIQPNPDVAVGSMLEITLLPSRKSDSKSMLTLNYRQNSVQHTDIWLANNEPWNQLFTFRWQSGGDQWRMGMNINSYFKMLSWCSVPDLLNKLWMQIHLSLPMLWTAGLILQAMLPRPLSHLASKPGSVKGRHWLKAGEQGEDGTRYVSSFLWLLYGPFPVRQLPWYDPSSWTVKIERPPIVSPV